MEIFFRNHYGFILGTISGAGFLMFCVEVYKPHKNFLVYIVCWGLSLFASALYRKLKRDEKNSPKQTITKKEDKTSAA
jgi:hypothetical protein